jgi:hypothetical protein
MHRRDGSERPAGRVDHRETDQIGVVELVGVGGFGQPVARDEQLDIAQTLRRITVGGPLQAGGGRLIGGRRRIDVYQAPVGGR